MPNGNTNPHETQPPDYTHARFEAARLPLVNDFNLTHEQAAQRLTAFWQAQNALDRQEWDAQIAADAQAARQEQEDRQHQADERQRLQQEEQDLASQEERKKNRNKFLPYNKVPVPTSIPKIASPLAIRKLKKGDYVEMYHFTNKGLAEAEASVRSLDDDAFALTRDEDGHHSFIPIAASKAKETTIPDRDLTWAEIDEAAPRLLQAMKENGWDDDRIQSHLQFWMALSAHEHRHDADEYGKRALIIYQAIIRMRWHNVLGTPQSFDLVPINIETIKQIRDELVHKANKSLREEASQASIPSLPSTKTPLTITPSLSSPQPPLHIGFTPP